MVPGGGRRIIDQISRAMTAKCESSANSYGVGQWQQWPPPHSSLSAVLGHPLLFVNKTAVVLAFLSLSLSLLRLPVHTHTTCL